MSEEWYVNGLRFNCTLCGNCCTGPPGSVWFNEEEGKAMAAKLGLDVETFLERYARRMGDKWSLNEREIEGRFDCVFLDRDTPRKATCRLYEARPTQCRTWPFWPKNLKTPQAWENARRQTPCPGMDSGTLVPIEAIRVQRDMPIG